MHAFDGRTDRQTDRQMDSFLIAIPRLHSMQHGKNADVESLLSNVYVAAMDCQFQFLFQPVTGLGLFTNKTNPLQRCECCCILTCRIRPTNETLQVTYRDNQCRW